MNDRAPSPASRILPIGVAALSILALALPALAAEGASLRLFHGPDDTGSMRLQQLRILLDGRDLGVSVPPTGADPEKALYAGNVGAGIHKLEVEAVLENAGSVFSYLDGYRITMRGLLEVEVLPGEGVAIRSRIVPRGDPTAAWAERNRLVMTLSAADGPPPLAVAAAEPAPTAAAASAPAPAATPAPAAAATPPPASAATPPPAAAPSPPAANPAPLAANPPAATRAPPPPARTEPPPSAEPPRAIPSPPPTRVASAPIAPQPLQRPTAPAPAPTVTSSQPPAVALQPRQRAAEGACQLGSLRFDFGAASLSAEARAELDRFAACIAPGRARVRVEGHTDARGTEEYNRWLAWDRAAAVSAYLRERGLERRVVTRFVGSGRPLCGEATDDCYARNRRVELVTEE